MIRLAQLLLIAGAAGLWVASRLPWAAVGSFDGLGQPKVSTLTGAQWSTALIPFAVLLIAAALAGLAVRGWLLRAVAVLLALVAFALGYLGISLIVMPDVAPRASALAGVEIVTLVSSQRYVTGAVLTLAVAVGVLLAAVLLMRSGVAASRFGAAGPPGAAVAGGDCERLMWEALDEGRDPTDPASENEGR